MQFFEVLFLLVLAVGIVRLLLGPIHPRLAYSTIAIVGLGVMVLGVVTEGFRWQMIPAYVGFGVLLLASLKKSETRPVWRALGALPLFSLISASAVLTHELPVFSLPEPSGPYGVGTFEYSITDDSRKERYAPTRNRELYVEVWYPAEKSASGGFPFARSFRSSTRATTRGKACCSGISGTCPRTLMCMHPLRHRMMGRSRCCCSITPWSSASPPRTNC